ncbi:MAG: 4Fe-4S dicluster domain-containing protein [Armatimonadota bacterium]|nr:4Fe-4S dicluster domain-containing protein [Armatimonadota bacterium]
MQAIAEDRIRLTGEKKFCDEITALSGQPVISCYQCGECTAGCPVAFTADIMPNQVTRMVQVGLEEPVLRSRMIWLCVGCETCTTRCPRGIELAKVMDALRETAVARKIKPSEPSISTFHKTFLDSVERMGRVHEITMLAEYKLRSGKLFSDLLLGARMFLKGKLALIPEFLKGRSDIKKIFNKTFGK